MFRGLQLSKYFITLKTDALLAKMNKISNLNHNIIIKKSINIPVQYAL